MAETWEPPAIAELPVEPSTPSVCGPYRQLRPWQRTTLFAVPVILVVGAWGIPAAVELRHATPAATDDPTDPPGPPPDGARLYAQNCAECHGPHGDGNGPAGAYIFPRARNFGEGKFRLATTRNGVPTDDDLLSVLRHGIPGSAMPSFEQLGEPALRALVGQVRRLTRAGVLDRLRRLSEQEGDINWADLCLTTDKLTRPGKPLAIPETFPPSTPESLVRGRRIFMNGCASCHGPDGRGNGPQVRDLKNSDGTPNRPRDLTVGQFKGGAEPGRVYARIVLGMPGSPMPASTNLATGDVLDLVNYVLSLSRSEATAAPASGPAKTGEVASSSGG